MKSIIKVVLGIFLLFSYMQVFADNSDFRFGILAHNKGFIASKTEDGFDLNLAYHSLISSNTFGLDGFKSSWHLGGTVNSAGDTSFVYAGVLWGRDLGQSNWFVEFGGGLAIHNGNLHDFTDDRRLIGSRVLFRYEVGIGYRFNSRFSFQFVNDHISNGGIFDDKHNQGMDTYGGRLIYSFQ